MGRSSVWLFFFLVFYCGLLCCMCVGLVSRVYGLYVFFVWLMFVCVVCMYVYMYGWGWLVCACAFVLCLCMSCGCELCVGFVVHGLWISDGIG